MACPAPIPAHQPSVLPKRFGGSCSSPRAMGGSGPTCPVPAGHAPTDHYSPGAWTPWGHTRSRDFVRTAESRTRLLLGLEASRTGPERTRAQSGQTGGRATQFPSAQGPGGHAFLVMGTARTHRLPQSRAGGEGGVGVRGAGLLIQGWGSGSWALLIALLFNSLFNENTRLFRAVLGAQPH